MEYELIDTGVFNDNRYFDVFVEYAKAGPEDILVKITAINRGPDEAELHILPTLWYRNDWAGWLKKSVTPKPSITQAGGTDHARSAVAVHSTLGHYTFYFEGDVPLLFTDNETNRELLQLPGGNESQYLKDGINNYVVKGQQDAVNPGNTGTKMAAHYRHTVAAGQSAVVRVRLTAGSATENTLGDPLGADFEQIFALRLKEADEFYKSVIPPAVSPDKAAVMRQALAGMLWSKQYYYFDGEKWLGEHDAHPLFEHHHISRNHEWFHMLNEDIISMPDKWEYPWYAAWDLAFHTLPLSIVDVDFAKEQMKLMLKRAYMHPNGQIPAYEWNFSDVNPPVHAWATLFLHRMELSLHHDTDADFLRMTFHKLLLNFTW